MTDSDSIAQLLAAAETLRQATEHTRRIVAHVEHIIGITIPPEMNKLPGRRGLEILALVAQGRTKDQIAKHLYINKSTVSDNLGRTYRALGARSGPHAIALAIRAGLLPGTYRHEHHRSSPSAPAHPPTRTGDNVTTLHPATTQILRWFAASHLPDGIVRDTSELCGQLARDMADTFPAGGPELSAGLRKLLEAKDCFVRCAIAAKDRA